MEFAFCSITMPTVNRHAVYSKQICRLTIPNWYRFRRSNQYATSHFLSLSLFLKLFACVFRMNCRWLNVGINMYPCNKYALPQWKVYRPHIFTTITICHWFLFDSHVIRRWEYAILRTDKRCRTRNTHAYIDICSSCSDFVSAKRYIGINIQTTWSYA